MSIKDLTPAKSIPDDITVVIEIPANSDPVKYEVDKDTGLLEVDRFMPTAMHYPANYGFVPNTLSDDGDPVDVLVMSPFPIQAGAIIRCRAIGVLKMTDESGEDAKVLALPIKKICKDLAHIESLDDLPAIELKRIQHFFEHYKGLEEGKWVKVDGWEDVDAAKAEIENSIERFSK